MGTKKSRSTGSKHGFAAAVWILGFCIIVVLFIIFLPRILDSLEKTDFFSRIGVGTPRIVSERAGDPPPEEQQKQNAVSIVINDSPPAPPQNIQEQSARESSAALPAKPSPEPAPAPRQEPAVSKETKPAAVAVPSGQTQLKIWFVEIQSDGAVSRKEIARDVPSTDTPLTAAITALLSGPNVSEKGKGSGTLIPEGTRLLGASVKNGVATINFSEEFQYNRFGVEGYMGQLMQVVYTATAFPTVDSVQFLIEGELSEFIGSEGVWIGSPLSRSTFR
jgi:spore germination protein GerM